MRLARLLATAAGLTTAASACGSSGGAGAGRPDASSHVAEDAGVTSSSDAGKREGGEDSSTVGACQGDACLPIPDGVLVSGQHTPIGIALDDDNVYWMNLGTYSTQTKSYSGAQLMKCAKAGCGNAPTVLASGPWNGSTRLAVSSGNVYWATQNLLLSCATDGCVSEGPTVLWAGDLAPTDVAVGAASIYFGSTVDDGLLTCPIDGCGADPTVLWSSTAPPAPIALDGPTVYFATTGISLLSCVAGACAPILVGGTPTAMAIGNANVYIGTRGAGSPGAVASCPETDCTAGLTIVANNLSNCVGIAVDATEVYFTDQGMIDVDGGTGGAGSVSKCPLSGCNDQPAPIAGFVNFPQQIAVDATNAYWTDFGSSTDPQASDDGRVMAVPK
ncbi:MAG: hypothetical protein ACLP1X_07675 [Polyangiaceae bacterium]